MTTEQTLERIVEEVNKISRYICLKLPSGAESVRLQIKQINKAQEQLRAIQDELYMFGGHGSSRLPYQYILTFKALINYLLLDGDKFKLLAEEYFLDPEGTVALLNDQKRRDCELLHRIRALQTTGLKQHQIILALWHTLSTDAVSYQAALTEYDRLAASLSKSVRV